jgi:hypothetical protein
LLGGGDAGAVRLESGRIVGTAPVATIAFAKSIRSRPPSAATSSADFGPVNFASPNKTVTPADFRSNATPLRSFATTDDFHCEALARSNRTASASTPIPGPSVRSA